MEVLYLVGRVLLGIYFLFSGMNHLTRTSMMAGYVRSKGLPAPTLAVLGTGLQMLVGGAMLALGWYVWVASLILIVFLVLAAFLIHNFWTVRDSQMQMVEMVNFTKNLALASALLALMALSYATGWNPYGLAP